MVQLWALIIVVTFQHLKNNPSICLIHSHHLLFSHHRSYQCPWHPFLWSSPTPLVAQRVKSLPAMQKTWVRSLAQEDPLRRKWKPTPVLLPGKSHGQRSLADYSPWDYKQSDMTEQLHSPTPYKLTARSNQNCIAVCRSTQNQQDIHLCSCFSIVTALNEIEAMHWAPVFQTVFSRDYGKVHLHFKKKGPIQSVSRNNWFGLFLMQRFRDLIEIQDLDIWPNGNCSVCESLSHVQLFMTPWTIAPPGHLSMGLPRQGYWSGLPFPSPEVLPNPEIEPGCATLRTDFLLSESPGKPHGGKLGSFKKQKTSFSGPNGMRPSPGASSLYILPYSSFYQLTSSCLLMSAASRVWFKYAFHLL